MEEKRSYAPVCYIEGVPVYRRGRIFPSDEELAKVYREVNEEDIADALMELMVDGAKED
jgi:uncharacterized protein (DUF433 family)